MMGVLSYLHGYMLDDPVTVFGSKDMFCCQPDNGNEFIWLSCPGKWSKHYFVA